MILTLQVGRKLEQDDIWWIGEAGVTDDSHIMVILQPPHGEWYCSCGDNGFQVRKHVRKV